MRILFDKNVPTPLKSFLIEHRVETAAERGWGQLQDGDLLKAAETAGFDVMITADQNMAYQQNLQGRELAVIVLSTNNWSVVRQNTRKILHAVNAAEGGRFQVVSLGP